MCIHHSASTVITSWLVLLAFHPATFYPVHPSSPIPDCIFSLLLCHLLSMIYDTREHSQEIRKLSKQDGRVKAYFSTPQPATRTVPMPCVSVSLPGQSSHLPRSCTHSASALCTLFHFNFKTSEALWPSVWDRRGRCQRNSSDRNGYQLSGDGIWGTSHSEFSLILVTDTCHEVYQFNYF